MQGNEIFELSRGQRAITDEDILKLPQLLNNIDYAEYAGKYNGMQNSNNDFINLKSSKDDTITIGAFKQKKYLDLRIHTMYAKTKETTTTQQMQKPLPQRPRRVSVMFPSIAVYSIYLIMSIIVSRIYCLKNRKKIC